MKKSLYLLLTIFVFPWSLALAQQSINGYITKSRGLVYFYSAEPSKPVVLSAGSQNVADVLSKLNSYDALRGTAESTPKGLILQSIDFVGLKRLIGRWEHPQAGMTFRSFTDVSIYTNAGNPMVSYGNYKYAITPGTGNNWNIFFTDENQVVLSSIAIRGDDRAVMTVYDSAGAIKGTLPLYKVKH